MNVIWPGSEWVLSSETLVSWTHPSKTNESSTDGDMMGVNNHFKIAHSNPIHLQMESDTGYNVSAKTYVVVNRKCNILLLT